MDAALLKRAQFPETDYEGWKKLAQKAIGEADFDTTLVSKTDDGISISPLNQRERHISGVVRQHPEQPWSVVQRIDDPDAARANRQALEDIEGGATGLSLVFEGAPNAFGFGIPATPEALQRVLEGVQLSDMTLRVDTHPSSRMSIDWLVDYFGQRNVDPARLRLAFGIDPAAIFAGTGRLRMSIEAVTASMPQSLAHFFALGLPGVLLEADGRVYHNAGATEGQEIGAMLATSVQHLRLFQDARQPLVYAAPHIGFATSIDQDQFLGIAKLRAIRRLWTRIQEECRIEPSTAAIHTETSYRMMTLKDPETNILRTTIACFAAAAGGADSISILPYTLAHGLPDAFARRVARNTHLILAGESSVGFVSDPAAGSGAVEALTEGLCDAAWQEFQKLESEGGILESLSAGKFQQRVLAARAARSLLVSEGSRPIVGTTLYPLKSERPVSVLTADRRAAPTDGTIKCEPLFATRLDEKGDTL